MLKISSNRIGNQRGFIAVLVLVCMAIVPSVLLWQLGSMSKMTGNVVAAKSFDTKARMIVIKNQLMALAQDVDGDNRLEVFKEDASNTLPALVQGTHQDEWGSQFRYCTWDSGIQNTRNSAYTDNNVAPPEADLVFKLISAGRNRAFETTCDDATAKGDDQMMKVYHADIVAYQPPATSPGVDFYTKLLLNGEGYVHDSSAFCQTISMPKFVGIDRNTFAAGTGSIYFNGRGYLTIANNEDWYLGAEDFTIEAWVYPIAPGAILDKRTTSTQYDGWVFYVGVDNRPGFAGDNDGAAPWEIDLVSATPISLNAWSHLAVVREKNKLSIYVNGMMTGTITSSVVIKRSTTPLYIGANSMLTPFQGYIDELKYAKGKAKIKTNFIPTTVQYLPWTTF